MSTLSSVLGSTFEGQQGISGYSGYSGISGALSPWNIKTSNYTATDNDRIIADTSSGPFTITLPPTPPVGTYVVITDGADWNVNNLTIARNGSTIEGYSEDIIVSSKSITLEFIYSGNTWQITVTTGAQGFSGMSGYSGINGTSGYSGFSGYSGTGISGYSGYSGFSGYSGIAGPTIYPSSGIVVSTGSSWGTSKAVPSGDIVGTIDYQTISSKILVNPTINGYITEDIHIITDDVAFEINPNNGSIQIITLGASRTPKATVFPAGSSVTLMVDDGSAYTLTWTDTTFGPSGVIWKTDSGVAPTLNTSGYTFIVLWKVGSQIYGARVGNA